MTQKTPDNSLQIDVPLVWQLVSSQFPDWAYLPINPVKNPGHDNRTFRLGDKMSVRLPSAQWYAAHVKTEQAWLTKLAAHLPLPIPVPLAMGEPDQRYPWQWSINNWLEGENATLERIEDLSQFAIDLADFLNALRSIDASEAPLPGPDNFFRGGDLSVYDAETRECISELQDTVDVKAATAVWESALAARYTGPAVWLHGDVAAGNLLVNAGRLCAVIDFGQLAAGDPACDATIAWTFFSGPSRDAFRRRLSLDSATWLRGRGWAMWKALLELRKYQQSNPVEFVRVQGLIDDILSDLPVKGQ